MLYSGLWEALGAGRRVHRLSKDNQAASMADRFLGGSFVRQVTKTVNTSIQEPL